MRRDALGHLGSDAAIIPHIDKFASEDAVSFSSAYSQNPVCVPSRCSFLSGLYPHVRGHRTLSHMLHQDESSLFKELLDDGYYVWMNPRNDFLPAQNEGVFDDTSIYVLSDHGDYIGDYGIAEKIQNTFEECLVNVPFMIKPQKYEIAHTKATMIRLENFKYIRRLYEQDKRFNFEMIRNRVKRLCPEQLVEEVQSDIRNGADLFQLLQRLRQMKST